MTNSLMQNVHKMANSELIGLAKNRWLPAELQMKIAKTHYNRAQWYLAENAGLDKTTRDFMWSDECNRGYSLKAMMIMCGHYLNEPEKYTELYERYPAAWNRSSWKMATAFFGHPYMRSAGKSVTPPELLNRIYDERYAPELKSASVSGPDRHYSYSSSRYELERLAKHNNVDLKLAIKLSQCGVESVQKMGFQKIVELS